MKDFLDEIIEAEQPGFKKLVEKAIDRRKKGQTIFAALFDEIINVKAPDWIKRGAYLNLLRYLPICKAVSLENKTNIIRCRNCYR